MVFIYKFSKKEILIQSPGEPLEHPLGEVQPKKFELHKIELKTKCPEGSIYAFLKKGKYEVTGPEKHIVWEIF